MITVELLYFDGCPSWENAWCALGRVLAETRSVVTVHLRNIEDVPAKQRHGFAGSPTIRINGRDLEGWGGPPVMACRLYAENNGRGWPSPELLQGALTAAGQQDHPQAGGSKKK
jgi:hypothetical protein